MSVDKSPLFTGFHSVFEAHERGETIILGDYSDFLCDHLWVSKAGSGYRENPVEVCAKCGVER